MMIALGMVILLIGCGVAVYRNRQAGDVTDRNLEADNIVRSISSDFGSGSGALSLTRLGTGYDLIEIEDGRSAMIHVETMDGDSLTLYIPDKPTFENGNDGDNSVVSRFLPIATDDGMVVPGKLEVTLVG